MSGKKGPVDLSQGQERLDEIGRRLGSMFGASKDAGSNSGGVLGGLGTLIAQLGQLAERAERSGGQFHGSGETSGSTGKPFKAVYGFSVKSGLGEQKPTVEPFGNVHRTDDGSEVEVQEIREPMIDLFDEADQILLVVEVPGIRADEVTLELNDDVLSLAANGKDKKYRKEVLLPESFTSEQMSFKCHNGVLEIRLSKGPAGG